MDVFMEKIVVKRKNIKDYALSVLLVVAALVVFIALSFIPLISGFMPVVIIGVGYGLYRLLQSRNIEFEYIVTNGDLDIDRIIAQRKRKRIFSASCKDFDIVAKYDCLNPPTQVQNVPKRIDAISSMDSGDIYYLIVNYKTEKTAVLFEPDERMLNSFKTFIPRKVVL